MAQQYSFASLLKRPTETSTSSDGLFSSQETLSPREATFEDKDFILSYGERFHSFSPYSEGSEYDEDSVWEFCQFLIENDTSTIIIHEKGIILGIISPLWFDPKISLATELAWYADEGGTKLLKAFESWAIDQGCDYVNMLSLSTGNEEYDNRLDKFYEKRGYKLKERSYLKPLGVVE